MLNDPSDPNQLKMIDMKKANRMEPINLKLLMNYKSGSNSLMKSVAKGGTVDRTKHEALQNICKEKDKIINYYTNLSTSLKK